MVSPIAGYPPSGCDNVPTCRKLRFLPQTRRRDLPILEGAGNLREIAGRPGRCPDGQFVFYEGPPTANGLPHPGHCLTRSIKDLFPRYKTMRGYLCRRKAGWDTHGLPVEVEVCKELGIHSKEEIEAFGVEPFIRKCVESVFRYTQQWEQLTERLGFWIHLDEAYVTFHQSYVESVWWALKTAVRPRPALPGPQDRLVVGPRRHGAEFRRSRPRLPRSGRPERVCAVPIGRGEGRGERGEGRGDAACGFARTVPQRRSARLDHHPLDAAEQPVRRRQARPGILGRLGRGRNAEADSGLGVGRSGLGQSPARSSPSKRRCPAKTSSAFATCRRSTAIERTRQFGPTETSGLTGGMS